MLDAAASLNVFSGRGRIVPELNDIAFRELFVDPFRLIYQVTPSEVTIVALLHQARDFLPGNVNSSEMNRSQLSINFEVQH